MQSLKSKASAEKKLLLFEWPLAPKVFGDFRITVTFPT